VRRGFHNLISEREGIGHGGGGKIFRRFLTEKRKKRKNERDHRQSEDPTRSGGLRRNGQLALRSISQTFGKGKHGTGLGLSFAKKNPYEDHGAAAFGAATEPGAAGAAVFAFGLACWSTAREG